MNQGMSEQYLILHKVRGEPSFDCATQVWTDVGLIWITNSGHRAYPVWQAPLIDTIFEGNVIMKDMPPIPTDWPDHFQVQGEKPPPSFNIMDTIHKMLPKITRRI